MARWKKGLGWIIIGAFLLSILMFLVFWRACSNQKLEGHDHIGPEKRLRASFERITELRNHMEKYSLGGEFGETLGNGLAMVEAKRVPPTPFLMVTLLVRNKQHMAFGGLGLCWLKKEENPELSTIHDIIIQVGQGKTSRDFTVPLVEADALLMPRGYVWETEISTDIVPGETISYKISKGDTDSATKGETILLIGEGLLNQPLTVLIRDKAGHQSNAVGIWVGIQ